MRAVAEQLQLQVSALTLQSQRQDKTVRSLQGRIADLENLLKTFSGNIRSTISATQKN